MYHVALEYQLKSLLRTVFSKYYPQNLLGHVFGKVEAKFGGNHEALIPTISAVIRSDVTLI